MYQFTALVMGYRDSPRIFTKVLKPVFAYLRSRGHVSSVYIDDTCLQGDSYTECLHNVNDTVTLLDQLGFTIALNKSVLVPSKCITFLGFLLCSETMTVRLTESKANEIIEICQTILGKKRITIRLFSKVIGKLVASAPAVDHAPLYFKPLEKN